MKSKLREWEVEDANGNTYNVLMTDHWTIIDPTWTADWVMQVMEAEREVHHKICGYPTNAGTPCKNYPIDTEEIEDEDKIGKCGLHAEEEEEPEELRVKEHNVVPLNENTELAESKVFHELMDIAGDMFNRCESCNYRLKCDEYNEEENARCVKERDLFNALMEEIVQKYNLVDAIDQMSAFTLAKTFVDYVKTTLYEAHYGTSNAFEAGQIQLRMQLNRLLNQNARDLGINRKFRIMLRKDGNTRLASQDLAQLLSDSEIEMKSETRSVKFSKKKKKRQKRRYIGTDGKPIKDREFNLEEYENENAKDIDFEDIEDE